MTPANDNLRHLAPKERAVIVEQILEEFDLLCLGVPSQHRIERELATRGFH